MNQIQLFNGTEFGEVRTVVNQNNEPMICLVDILQVLGSGRTNDVVNKLREDEYEKIVVIDNLGRPQNVLFVKESGFYKVVLRSNSPKADKFTDWVTSEVLPSLRKNGGYIVGQENLTPEELLAQALTVANRVLVERDKRIAQQNETIAIQAAQLEEQAPKIKLMNQFMAAKNDCKIGDYAKILSNGNFIIGEIGLFKYLRSKQIIYKEGKSNKAKQEYTDRGWLNTVPYTYEIKKYNTLRNDSFVTLTPKGQVELGKMILNDKDVIQFVAKKNRRKVEKFFD